MRRYDTLESVPVELRRAVADLLLRLADDELIIGHCESGLEGIAPTRQERETFLSMARDETAHAQEYYRMLHDLGGPDPDALMFGRSRRAFRCASLVCLADDVDWASCVLRKFLYDSAETVRLAALSSAALTPLARLATDLHRIEQSHLIQGRSWVLQLCDSTSQLCHLMQGALDRIYPHALGVFEPTEAGEPLAQAGICPHEEELRQQWESAVAPVFLEVGLAVPAAVRPVFGGRVGQHPETLTKLLDDLRLRHREDRAAAR